MGPRSTNGGARWGVGRLLPVFLPPSVTAPLAPAAAPRDAIVDVRLLVMDGSPPRDGQAVLIEGERHPLVGPTRDLPAPSGNDRRPRGRPDPDARPGRHARPSRARGPPHLSRLRDHDRPQHVGLPGRLDDALRDRPPGDSRPDLHRQPRSRRHAAQMAADPAGDGSSDRRQRGRGAVAGGATGHSSSIRICGPSPTTRSSPQRDAAEWTSSGTSHPASGSSTRSPPGSARSST